MWFVMRKLKDIPLDLVIMLDIILPRGEQAEQPICCLSAANSISLARTSAWYTICGYMYASTCVCNTLLLPDIIDQNLHWMLLQALRRPLNL